MPDPSPSDILEAARWRTTAGGVASNPLMFHCYSDASMSVPGIAGYGVIVVGNGERRVSGVVEVGSTVEAELKAMIVAARMVPRNGGGFANSDLKDIKGILDVAVSYARRYIETINELRSELSRTGLTARYVPKGHRSAFFGHCHRMSRRALRRYIHHGVKRQAEDLRGGGVQSPRGLILSTDEWNATLR